MVVEHVDEVDEAPRAVVVLGAEARHVADQHGVETAGDLEVVVLRARAVTQRRELEPDDVVGPAHGGDAPPLDVERGAGAAGLGGDLLEGGAQRTLGRGVERGVVDLEPFQRTQPVVGGAVEILHRRVPLEQLDGRQEALALEAVLVEVVGRGVGGRDQRHAAFEQAAQQAAEQHGVGDVGDDELVEAEHAGTRGEALGDRFERIGLALQLLQLGVHAVHETVEVDAYLEFERQAVVERIHQEGLAAPDATPQVETVHRWARLARASAQPLEPAVALALRGRRREQVVIDAIERLHRGLLRRVGVVAEAQQVDLIAFQRGHRGYRVAGGTRL